MIPVEHICNLLYSSNTSECCAGLGLVHRADCYCCCCHGGCHFRAELCLEGRLMLLVLPVSLYENIQILPVMLLSHFPRTLSCIIWYHMYWSVDANLYCCRRWQQMTHCTCFDEQARWKFFFSLFAEICVLQRY